MWWKVHRTKSSHIQSPAVRVPLCRGPWQAPVPEGPRLPHLYGTPFHEIAAFMVQTAMTMRAAIVTERPPQAGIECDVSKPFL